jgi:hypothetical protein
MIVSLGSLNVLVFHPDALQFHLMLYRYAVAADARQRAFPARLIIRVQARGGASGTADGRPGVLLASDWQSGAR